MKMRILILSVIFLLVACNENEDSTGTNTQLSSENNTGTTVTEVSGTTSSVLADYNQSPFSAMVYLHKTEDKLLIDYNFFPEGTDVDQQAGTASIPCDTTVSTDGALATGLSAPLQNGECAPTVITLTGGSFNNDGIVFTIGGSVTIFESDFSIRITANGFVDAQSSASISADAATADLEAIHAALLSQRNTH